MLNLVAAVRAAEPALRAGRRLVRLHPDRDVVFVGDTHGDLDATEQVFRQFAAPDTTIVFLGDAVDRGPHSRENLVRILAAVAADPEHTVFLMGNHEAWDVARFSPADFWEDLSPVEEKSIGSVLRRLPLAAWHPAGVLALHGALPDLARLDDFDGVELGSAAWRDVTWGDWSDAACPSPPGMSGSRRPSYGPDVFAARAERLGLQVLVRSHQPDAPTYLFADRCLTLFTSHAYGDGRRCVAVLPHGGRIRTARDLPLAEV